MLRLQGADQTHSSETYKRQMHIHHFCWVTQRFWWSDLLHVCCIILNDVKGLTGSKYMHMHGLRYVWGPHIVTAHCLCINTCLCVGKSIHIVLFTAYIQVLVYNLVSFSSNMPLKRWVQTLLSFECSWKSTLMQQFIVSPSIPGSLTEIKSSFCRLKLFSSEFSHPARSLHCHR